MYLCIISTWACNLNCTYCKIRKTNSFISEKDLKKSVDLLLTSKDDELKFEFFGGEPLMLPFPVIKSAILYGREKARQAGKFIEFIMTTNGLLLNEEKIDFFREQKVSLIISLDGHEGSQNKNRPLVGGGDSYSLITRNLKFVFKKKINCFCYTVVTPATVRDLRDNFKSLLRLGFKKVWLMTGCGHYWRKSDLDALDRELRKIEKIYLKLLGENKVIYHNLKNWFYPFRMNTELVVNLDGKLYSACLAYLLDSDQKRKKYIIGNLHNLKGQTIDELNKKRLTNMEAIKVVWKENWNQKILKSNIAAGAVMTRHCSRLKKKVLENPKLKRIYEKEAGYLVQDEVSRAG
jgi:sulfatase maturation enzyme AslB (radical SAM superfamily)